CRLAACPTELAGLASFWERAARREAIAPGPLFSGGMDVSEERSGAAILVETLVRQGVEFVFGYPGGAVLPIYDELFSDQRLRHILVRHEAGAAHAAEGYARSTGKPGVVLVTSGPGATNAITGIADAFMDSI